MDYGRAIVNFQNKVEGRPFARGGTGKTKQEAEQNAATAALKVMDAVAALGAT